MYYIETVPATVIDWHWNAMIIVDLHVLINGNLLWKYNDIHLYNLCTLHAIKLCYVQQRGGHIIKNITRKREKRIGNDIIQINK